MPYPSHHLLQFGGGLGGADEIWSCGIRMIRSDAASPLDEEDYLDDVGVPALTAWMQRADSLISNQCTLEFVKMNEIGPDGRYVDTVTHERTVTNVTGSAFSGTLPFQACVVLTWRTNVSNRGPGTKGRIYSPMPVVTVSPATGLFDPGFALQFAQSAAELLNDIDATVGALGWIRPAIVSDRAGGVANVIDRVTVDNRVDIQRRRGNQLVPVQRGVDIEY